MSEQTPFKKRLTTILKPDRRLSPLNPQAAIAASKIQESPPQSPLAVLLSSDSDSYSLPQTSGVRKKSVGLNLRKLAANEKPISTISTTAVKPAPAPKAAILQNTTILDNPNYRRKFLNEPRSHWLFRSTSLTDFPKWSGLYEETIFKKNIGLDKGNLQGLIPDVSIDSPPRSSDSARKRTLSHQPFESKAIDIQGNFRGPDGAVTKGLDAIPAVARLEKFAASLTAWDIELYTSIVETSRRAKNYLWKTEPVAIWPDWHEGLCGPSNSASPMISYLEIKYDPPTPTGSGINRPPSRGRAANSPVLTPLPMNRDRSMSPGFSLDPDKYSDSDSYSERGEFPRPSRRPGSKLRKNLSISTKHDSSSPGKSPETASVEFRHTRSHSDGDLTEYLKGFSNLKTSLQIAQVTCNNEIKKILDEIQYQVEKGIEMMRKESNRPSTTTTSADLARNSLSNSKSSLIAVYQKDSARNSTSKNHGDQEPVSSSNASSSNNLTNSESSRLDTIMSANSAEQSKLETILSAGLNEQSSPFNFDSAETTPKPLEKKYHKKSKSDSIKLAMDLRLDSSQTSQEDIPTESPFMKAISSVISVAQNILNLDVTALLTPQLPQKYIAQIQKLQQLWTENPEWQLQELVVRLLIVFAGVVRLVDHFDEDFRSWDSLTNNFVSPGKNFLSDLNRNRRSSRLSIKSSPRDSPTSFSFKRGSYSSAGAGADSSDFDEATYDSETSRESPSRRNPSSALFLKGFKPIAKSPVRKYENASQSAFRAAVDEEQTLNVLLEHDGDGVVTYVSPGVKKIFLYSPEVILNTKTIPFLQDSSRNIFLDNALSTTKLRPNLQLCADAKRADGRSVKVECNGLVNFSELASDQIKNVVWIIRPMKVVGNVDYPTLLPLSNDEFRDEFIPNVDLALCNICERSVPAIHFAVHSDICVKVHKTEMELILLNDELRNSKQSADDRLGLINEEIATIKNELSNCLVDKPSETKVQYLNHLRTLRELTETILTAADDALALKIPKDDIAYRNSTSEKAVGWSCPSEKAFLPEFVNDIATENCLLSNDLSAIGKGCYSLGKAVQDCSNQKLKMVAQMKTEIVMYSDCLQTEQQLLTEIEIQTSKVSALDNDVNNEGSKFELKEVGGVMVKIPSVVSLRDGFGFSQGETSMPASNGDSISQTATPPLEYEDANAPKLLKRPSKQNSLRIQTFHDSNNDGARRTSLRNPRMVVGDKSLEIESLLSPVLTASSGNLRRSSLIPAASSFSSISPIIGSPINALPSIKDYELVKAISKGAFGSVFLAKKKITGVYYAIKVLRKADMVAKNQVSNIKSERTILTQLDSPYVVKLYSTFQSRNHIYLVMEYLNGGDCAALLKAMGQFDEPWAKQYLTEVIQGLEFLHQRDIVHRDLKPDNILISTTGHVKLTDFGLSKAGFIGRRAIGVGDVPVKTPDSMHSMSSVRGLMNRRESIASVSSNDSSAGLGSRLADKLEDKSNKKLVGTPDYLAPESILGLGQGISVDWWAVGVILYEFLNGIPPFHAATPQLVFENILMRKIEWDEELQLSGHARDLMDRLMCADVEKRLGTRGAAEVKCMTWFEGTDWDNLMDQKVFFVPTVKSIEDTDYFDTRGAQKPAKLSDSDEEKSENGSKDKLPSATATEDSAADFGEAVYKNLPLLEKANLKMMSKINQDFPEGEQWLQRRRDSLPIHNLGSPTLSFGSPGSIQPPRSISPRHFSSIVSSRRDSLPVNPQASIISPIPISAKKKIHQPSNSLENLSRTSSSSLEPRMSPSPLSDLPRISYQSISQSGLKGYESDCSLGRSSSPDQSFKKRSQAYLNSAKQTLFETKGREEVSGDATSNDSEISSLDVLIAESNPVAAQILETILKSLNCRCVRVKTGGEVVQCALGEIKFDIIFVDVNLPVLTGDAAARMIKATANINMNTPVIALATNLENTTFSDFNHVLLKPVTRVNVESALQALNLLGNP